MARILCAWELGGGLGHLTNLAPIARRLTDAGHDVKYALRDQRHAASILGQSGEAAPALPVGILPIASPATYADILYNAGFGSTSALAGLVRAWGERFAAARPDLVLCDHAPSAMLAARAHGIPAASLGVGFFSPPRQVPLPTFRTWEPVDMSRVARSEAAVLRAMNRVLEEAGRAPLPGVALLFDGVTDLLITWPELDHYGERREAAYFGPITMRDHGTAPAWRPGSGPRVFAYLAAGTGGLRQLAWSLRAAGARTLVYLRGGTRNQVRALEADGVTCTVEPVRMREAIEGAEFLICHAGPATVAASLLGGKPLLMLPQQAEQYITAKRVEAMGAGMVHAGHPTGSLASAVTRLVDGYGKERAIDFATRHAEFDPDRMADRMVDVLAPSISARR